MDRINLRHIRASQYVQQFRVKMFYRPGKTNVIADALPRLTANDDNKPVSSGVRGTRSTLGNSIRMEYDSCTIVTNIL